MPVDGLPAGILGDVLGYLCLADACRLMATCASITRGNNLCAWSFAVGDPVYRASQTLSKESAAFAAVSSERDVRSVMSSLEAIERRVHIRNACVSSSIIMRAAARIELAGRLTPETVVRAVAAAAARRVPSSAELRYWTTIVTVQV